MTGNLTRDPELRTLPSGMAVCSLRIACNTRRKNNATGDWEDKPNYFDVTVWGAQGENAARYLSKGRPVSVDVRLEWREYQDSQGNKRQAIDIIADSVQFLGGRDDAGGGQGGGLTPRSDVPVDPGPFAPAPPRRPPPAPRRRRPARSAPRAGGRRHPVLAEGLAQSARLRPRVLAQRAKPARIAGFGPPSAGARMRSGPSGTRVRSRVWHNVRSARPPGARSHVRTFTAPEDFTHRGQAAQERDEAVATPGQEGWARQRPAQALPVLQGQDRACRLQG